MCDVCLSSPCAPRCPNAPDPVVIRCSRCKDGIEIGDEYAVIDGKIYCEGCIDEMPYSELITMLGGDWKTASREGADAAIW